MGWLIDMTLFFVFIHFICRGIDLLWQKRQLRKQLAAQQPTPPPTPPKPRDYKDVVLVGDKPFKFEDYKNCA